MATGIDKEPSQGWGVDRDRGMNTTVTRTSGTAFELPATAPQIRVTAGVGSAGQKTWNLRRPVTLIGSRRPAHIVLHDREISNAHCVIVNTGTDVLLKDLQTSKGTLCNREQADLVLLNDGDVVTLGSTKIQIAIRAPENENDDSGCGTVFIEPTSLPHPVTLHFEHTDKSWDIEDAVILIGHHNRAAVRLDHDNVATRHAVLFRFADGPAIYDLGSRTGISVNGEAVPIANLRQGDRIGIGPCTLVLQTSNPESAGPQRLTPSDEDATAENRKRSINEHEHSNEADHSRRPASAMAPLPHGGASTAAGVHSASLPALAQIGADLNALHANIAESWERLNAWQSRLLDDETELNKRNQDLTEREEHLDAKDAALRGHLHDVTQYSEQIAAREKELAAQLARVQEERDQTLKSRRELEKQEEELARRASELKRREHVVAQRWARLLSAKCPHCDEPLRIGMSGPQEAPP